jgi:hypothetical protein
MCPMIVDEDPRAPLNAGEIAAFCAAHPPFGVDAGALVARFEFADFQRAFAFMTLVAVEANRLDHHPDWRNVYRTVAAPSPSSTRSSPRRWCGRRPRPALEPCG